MRTKLVYVTSNPNKRDELEILQSALRLSDGRYVQEAFDLEIRPNSIEERLEIDLEVLVQHEAASAYEVVKVPCIVEHAGLLFDQFEACGYPGGLTKPMWNALGPRFLDSARLQDRGATAKAVVGYCDGMRVSTFVGRTHGRLTEEPRGSGAFYWDTIFVPDDPERPGSELTYAEIVDRPDLGLQYKVMRLSQSMKAMRACFERLCTTERNRLWC